MEGVSAYGAALAGRGFDFHKFVRQPQTIVRLLSWVSAPRLEIGVHVGLGSVCGTGVCHRGFRLHHHGGVHQPAQQQAGQVHLQPERLGLPVRRHRRRAGLPGLPRLRPAGRLRAVYEQRPGEEVRRGGRPGILRGVDLPVVRVLLPVGQSVELDSGHQRRSRGRRTRRHRLLILLHRHLGNPHLLRSGSFSPRGQRGQHPHLHGAPAPDGAPHRLPTNLHPHLLQPRHLHPHHLHGVSRRHARREPAAALHPQPPADQRL